MSDVHQRLARRLADITIELVDVHLFAAQGLCEHGEVRPDAATRILQLTAAIQHVYKAQHLLMHMELPPAGVTEEVLGIT